MSMNDIGISNMEQLLNSAPGGIAKLALDNDLTILYATDTFFSLIKNATEKIKPNAPLALLRIVYSADIIYVTQQLAAQKGRKDNALSIHFRTLQPNGSFKWVMINGTKTDEVYQSGTKAVPVYACIAMDVTDHMTKYRMLEQEADYHRTISELSRELFFVYEIAQDTLSFSELFREVFGRDSVVKEFSKKLEKTKLIHPSELPAVINIYKSIMGGKKQVRFEFRLFPKDGGPIWYVCYASIIFDENKNPFRVIGKLSTINPMRKEADLPPVPQLDPLTKVFAKDYAEKTIAEALIKQSSDSLSALLLIEVRNYKVINEVMKSVNGENILTSIADYLKLRFRTSDIIGRISLSEFVVYMKDICSDRSAYERAEIICREIESKYCYEHNRNGLSVNIGVAFSKGEQIEYPTLMANAKAALVMAKKESGSAFEVFYGAISN